jgi:hypothetical protein
VSGANVFISHAWSYPFADLVAALTARFEHDERADALFLWNDIFVGSQHKSAELPQEWWSNAFATAIRDIGHTVLVLQPWDAPLPLRRSWCLWELFSTLDAGARLDVVFPPAQAAQFAAALDTRFDDIAAAMSRIDARNAEAFHASDKRMIDDAVLASKGGYYAVNTLIHTQLRAWLLAQTRALVEARRAASGAAHPDTLACAFNLARLLHAHGQHAEAAALCCEVAELRAALHGGGAHADVLAPQALLASVRADAGDLRGALRGHRAVLRARRELLRDDSHPDVVDSQLALARCLVAFAACPPRRIKEQRPPRLMPDAPFALVRAYYVLLARYKHSTLALSVLALLATPLFPLLLLIFALNGLENIVTAIMSLGMLPEAARLCRGAHERMLAAAAADGGLPSAAAITRELACVTLLGVALRDSGHLAEAEPLLRDAAARSVATLGAAHADTLCAQSELADLLRERDELPEAEALFAALSATLSEQLGESHPDALAARVNVALCAGGRGALNDAATQLAAARALFPAAAADDDAARAFADSTPGRLCRAGERALFYTLTELTEKRDVNFDPESCENTRLWMCLCIALKLAPPERDVRMGRIFTRVLLRHTRNWRRRRMLLLWTAVAAVGAAVLVGLGIAFFGNTALNVNNPIDNFLHSMTGSESPPPAPPPPPPAPPPVPAAVLTGRRLLRQA